MGAVFLATTAGGEQVAVKVVELGAHEELIKRFIREAEIAESLNHEDIVRVFDHGLTETHAWMSMAYLDGFELTTAMTDDSFGMEDRIHLIIRVALALDAAHEAGIVHRDVKPPNIFMTRDGGVRVLDFGIARLHDSTMTKTGMVMGTPRYMAPEQTLGQTVERQTDIFALGVMAFEMLCGQHPWDRGGGGQLMLAMALKPSLNLKEIWPDGRYDLDEAAVTRLHAVLHKAIEQEPHRRYASMREFVAALQEFLLGDDGQVKLTSFDVDPKEWGQRQIDWAQARAARLKVEGPGSVPVAPPSTTLQPATNDRSGLVWIAVLALLLAIVGLAAWQILSTEV